MRVIVPAPRGAFDQFVLFLGGFVRRLSAALTTNGAMRGGLDAYGDDERPMRHWTLYFR